MLKYIDFYNSLGSVVGITAIVMISLNHFQKSEHFLFKMGCIQSFYLIEILNIFFGASKAKIFPTLLQLSSRLFVIWPICFSYNYTHVTVHLMLISWFISDTMRYFFYLSRNKILKFLRYNLFIVLYPIGTFCEIILVSRTENVATGLFKYFLRVIMLFYIPGFIFLFFHMLKRRKWTSKPEKNRKKD